MSFFYFERTGFAWIHFFSPQRGLEIKLQSEGLVFPSLLSLESIAFEVHEAYLKSGPGGAIGKISAFRCRWCGFDPWVGKILWRRKWQTATVFLPGKFHGQRSLAGATVHGIEESDMTEHTLVSFILSKLWAGWEGVNCQTGTRISVSSIHGTCLHLLWVPLQ